MNCIRHKVKHLSSCVSCCDAINQKYLDCQTKLSESQKLKQKQHFNQQQLLSTNFKCSNVIKKIL